MSLNEAIVDDGNAATESVTPHSLVTESNVRAALTADKGADARLTAWKVVDFTKKGDNYACIVTSVEVKYELADQSSAVVYVVKLNPCRDDALTEFINGIIYEKEAKFYNTLAPEMNAVLTENGQRELNIPKCFYVSLEKGKEIIFLEDLRTRGYKMHDHRRGMDTLHTTLVLKELARFHASSFLLEKKYAGENLREKYPFLNKTSSDIVAESPEIQKMLGDGLKSAQKMLTAVGGYEKAVTWLDNLIPKLADVFREQQCGKPMVVCHGDCWTNNLLFKYNDVGSPEDVMLLDMQVVQYSVLGPELSYFLYNATMGDFRKPNLKTLLEYYHGALTDIMKAAGQEAPFEREQFIKDFKAKILFGAIYGIISAPIAILNSADEMISSKKTNEGIEEMLRKASVDAMATLHNNPMLKPRFLSLIDEIMELGIVT